eukprot:350208-Chlamydomonas_euryale.AAC.1
MPCVHERSACHEPMPCVHDRHHSAGADMLRCPGASCASASGMPSRVRQLVGCRGCWARRDGSGMSSRWWLTHTRELAGKLGGRWCFRPSSSLLTAADRCCHRG